ncbi:uncharacterized protein LOC144471977 [Augochlora pura]
MVMRAQTPRVYFISRTVWHWRCTGVERSFISEGKIWQSCRHLHGRFETECAAILEAVSLALNNWNEQADEMAKETTQEPHNPELGVPFTDFREQFKETMWENFQRTLEIEFKYKGTTTTTRYMKAGRNRGIRNKIIGQGKQ